MKIKLKNYKFEIFKIIAIIISMIGVISTNLYLDSSINSMQNLIIQDQIVDMQCQGQYDKLETYMENSYKESIVKEMGISLTMFASAKISSDIAFLTTDIFKSLFVANNFPTNEIFIFAIDYDIFNNSSFRSLLSEDMGNLDKNSIYPNNYCLDYFNLSIGENVNFVPIEYDDFTGEALINKTGYYNSIFNFSTSIGGELKVNSWERFFQLSILYNNWPYAEQNCLILMDIGFFYENIYTQFRPSNLRDFSFEIALNVKLPQDILVNRNYKDIKSLFNDFQTSIIDNYAYHLSYLQPLLLDKINTFQQEIKIFKYLQILLSIPAFFVGVWFLGIIQKSIFQRDSDSILIKRINGVPRDVIIRKYLSKAVFEGILGGLLSYFFGLFITIFLQGKFLKFYFYNFERSKELSMQSFNLSLLAISIVGGTVLSLISSRIQLKKIMKNSQFLSRSEEQFQDFFLIKTSKKRFNILFLILIILLIFSQFENRSFINSENVFISVLSYYLFPFFSFISIFTPYFIISAFCFLILLNIEKITKSLKHLMKDKVSFENEFLISKFKRKIKENIKIIFLISISLGLVFQIITITNTYTERENEMALFLNGKSDIAFSYTDIDISTQSDFQKITSEFEDNLNHDIYEDFIYIPEISCQYNETGISNCWIRGIDINLWKNYFKDLPNSWFSSKFDKLMEDLKQNNTLIATKGFLEEKNLNIGDNITIIYFLNETKTYQKEFIIIGYYTRSPFNSFLSYDTTSSPFFYCNIDNFPSIICDEITYGFRISDSVNANLEEQYISLMNYMKNTNVSGNPLIDSTFSLHLRYDRIDVNYSDFMDIVTCQFLIIIMGGIIWILYLQILNLKDDMEKIYINGGNSKLLVRITMKEYMVYLGIGIFGAILSIVGNLGLFGFLNNFGEYPYHIQFPYLKMILVSVIVSFIFLVSLTLITVSQIKSLKTKRKSERCSFD
ncbi:FtsX-like permease family protein [Candidatus Harpocratesius sp.]